MYEELVKSLRKTRERVRQHPEVAMSVPPYQLSAAADAIEELSRRATEGLESRIPRWISVTERLPEIKEHHVSDTVLVYLADGGMAFDELEENIFGQSWFSCEHLPDVEEEMSVTHWMPLPEQPKEET